MKLLYTLKEGEVWREVEVHSMDVSAIMRDCVTMDTPVVYRDNMNNIEFHSIMFPLIKIGSGTGQYMRWDRWAGFRGIECVPDEPPESTEYIVQPQIGQGIAVILPPAPPPSTCQTFRLAGGDTNTDPICYACGISRSIHP